MTPAEYALDLCDRIAACTDVAGTTTRLFLSPATQDVHALLRAEMHTLGLTTRVDSAGNLRGVYATGENAAPRTLLLGSHIDTVPNAGRFDGILGVAVPLALVRMLDGRRLPFAIEVIAFSEEEGVRFRLPFLGSRALVGTLEAATLARTDADGISVAQALCEFGLDPAQLADAALTPGTFAFVEVHIEQGPVLESLALPLGIVTSIVGQTRFELTFTGQANHAGTTPMHLRQDALAAAAEFCIATEAFARASPPLVATVGILRAEPGAANIIPGTATCSLDVRHPDDTARVAAGQQMLAAAALAASLRNVHLSARETSTQASVPMDAALQAALQTAAARAGWTPHAMPSGAGHDAMILAAKVPSAMLFLRTPRGISHHPSEAVLLPDVEAALATCLHLLESLEKAQSST